MIRLSLKGRSTAILPSMSNSPCAARESCGTPAALTAEVGRCTLNELRNAAVLWEGSTAYLEAEGTIRMTWELSVYSMAAVFVLTIVFSMVGRDPRSRSKGVLQDYLLADGTLTRWPVLNLLLSSSFGINTMLYQGYLGATVGWWGLVVQAAWSAGFFFLLPYVDVIRDDLGLHHFLGQYFGKGTRKTAALASLLGITIFLGWETSIEHDSLFGILSLYVHDPQAHAAATWLLAGTVGGCLLYTVIGGLRSNGWANGAQNVLKFVAFSGVTVGLASAFINRGSSVLHATFPSMQAMTTNLGWLGLLSSIAFGFVWQFIDMGTWQSVAAAFQAPLGKLKRDVFWSGILVFITPGVLGTAFGVFLSDQSDGATNPVVSAARLIQHSSPVLQFLYVGAIIASVLSLIDGLFLAAAYAVVVDFLHPDESIDALDDDEDKSYRTLAITRATVIAMAALAVWGVPWMIGRVFPKLNLFFFSFTVVVAQLALFGPVLIAITWRRRGRSLEAPRMWLAIVSGAVAGFLAAIYGGLGGIKALTDSSSLITIAVSIGVAYAVARFDHRAIGASAVDRPSV